MRHLIVQVASQNRKNNFLQTQLVKTTKMQPDTLMWADSFVYNLALHYIHGAISCLSGGDQNTGWIKKIETNAVHG